MPRRQSLWLPNVAGCFSASTLSCRIVPGIPHRPKSSIPTVVCSFNLRPILMLIETEKTSEGRPSGRRSKTIFQPRSKWPEVSLRGWLLSAIGRIYRCGRDPSFSMRSSSPIASSSLQDCPRHIRHAARPSSPPSGAPPHHFYCTHFHFAPYWYPLWHLLLVLLHST